MRRSAVLLIPAFLFILGGCAATHASEGDSAMSSKINNAALDKLGWKLGCQAYSFRSLTLFETIDVLKKLDLKYIELYPGQRFSPEKPGVIVNHHLSAEQIGELKKKLADAGVVAVNYGVVGLPDETEARKVFEFGKAMGMKTIVSEPPEEKLEMLDRLCQEYNM